MTAPNCKLPLTEVILSAFRAYHRREVSWGIFHVCLDDGNWKLGPEPEYPDRPYTDEERKLVAIFEQLTPTQRAKISDRC